MPDRAGSSGLERGVLYRSYQSTTLRIILISVVVGVCAGLGAVGFRWLIAWFHTLGFGYVGGSLGFMGRFAVVLVPALGGAIVGPLVYFFAREAKGHGVPEVMEAVALRGGRIRPRVAVVKSLASSITIGSGGSVGREGPIVQIGAALGSTLAQVLRLPRRRVQSLVACGAAAGIAATFNAPIAGALFALEVVVRDFSAGRFGAVVISSVTASVIGRAAFGNVPAFSVPAYSLQSHWELLLYAALGILAAFLGLAFVRTLYWAENRVDGWRGLPDYLKTPLGGLAIGFIGLGFPQIFGVGYGAVSDALRNSLPLHLLLLLIPVKIAATSLTLSSGGSGGIFSPSLFLGAMMGAAFGKIANVLFPAVAGPPGAYALVAMSAVFAGVARAPITSIVILFELTGDYRIILPLMLATVLSTLISERMSSESIYTLKLVRRGVRLGRDMAIDLLEGFRVSDVYRKEPTVFMAGERMSGILDRIADLPDDLYPIVDKAGTYRGAIYLEDVPRVFAEREDLGEILVAQDVASHPPTVQPTDDLPKVLKQLERDRLEAIPVVASDGSKRVVGTLRRGDVVQLYSRELARREAERREMEGL